MFVYVRKVNVHQQKCTKEKTKNTQHLRKDKKYKQTQKQTLENPEKKVT